MGYTGGVNNIPQISDKLSSHYNVRLKNTTGGDVPIVAVGKITGQSGEFLTISRPDENSLSADRLVLFPQHITASNEYVRVALLPSVPLPVKYTASHGTPAVGDDVGTYEGSWELSKDYTGWRVVRIDSANELIWIVPAHAWGLWDNPFQQIINNEWFRPDHTADNFDGVEFEVMARVIGTEGEGQFIPVLFDAFGHLIKINGGAPTATPQPTPTPLEPSATPTPTPTPTPTGVPTWPYPTPTGDGCSVCAYDFVMVNVNINDPECAAGTVNGTHICTYESSNEECTYSKYWDGGNGDTYSLKVIVRVTDLDGVLSGYVRSVRVINTSGSTCPIERWISYDSAYRANFWLISPSPSGWYSGTTGDPISCGETGTRYAHTYGSFSILGWGG